MTTQEILAATTERLEFRRDLLDRIRDTRALTADEAFEIDALNDELLSRQRFMFVLEH